MIYLISLVPIYPLFFKQAVTVFLTILLNNLYRKKYYFFRTDFTRVFSYF